MRKPLRISSASAPIALSLFLNLTKIIPNEIGGPSMGFQFPSGICVFDPEFARQKHANQLYYRIAEMPNYMASLI
jgi:hypothetical protein